MTENEAIEAMQFDFKIGGEIHSQVLRNAVDVAIQALETVQKYKDIDFTGKIFTYAAYSDGKDYEHLKLFLKECYKKRRMMIWYQTEI